MEIQFSLVDNIVVSKRLVISAITIALLSFCMRAKGQVDSPVFIEDIAVSGRPYADSIQLRWAPVKTSVWVLANKYGYKIERYVVARNNTILQRPEKSELTTSPLRPLPLERWERIISRDQYHAIAAQALYGDSFEVDLSKSGPMEIVNKVRENDQRFAFAVFSADMSPSVAKATALWYTDKKVIKGEKYLYRIIINTPDNLKGSIFISPDDSYELIPPQHLHVKFEGSGVSLRWDKDGSGKYTAYVVERSTDGKLFKAISDTPEVTLSPAGKDNDYEYSTDSIPDLSKEYFYRVRGVTPFKEQSLPSKIASGRSIATVSNVPYINKGENIDNKSIRLTWEFDQRYNTVIKGFVVERSSQANGGFVVINPQNPIAPSARSYDDKYPKNVNYYRIAALGSTGDKYYSPVYFAQLVDSLPPSAPVGLKATINENGIAEVSWTPNQEEDIYGYRIYKSNISNEEPYQITSAPVQQARLIDTVNLNTLNKEVYYSVMAIDRNQNHSALSVMLKVPLPDKIKPQPPVFLPVNSDENGVTLRWIKSGSDDVEFYALYKRANGEDKWQKISSVPANSDSSYQYKDQSILPGTMSAYTVVAIDQAGLESDPAAPVMASRIDNKLLPPVKWKPARIIASKNQVILNWDYAFNDISSFSIYKAVEDSSLVMYKHVKGDAREIVEVFQSGKKYKYRILAVFNNGGTSVFSEDLNVSF